MKSCNPNAEVVLCDYPDSRQFPASAAFLPRPLLQRCDIGVPSPVVVRLPPRHSSSSSSGHQAQPWALCTAYDTPSFRDAGEAIAVNPWVLLPHLEGFAAAPVKPTHTVLYPLQRRSFPAASGIMLSMPRYLRLDKAGQVGPVLASGQSPAVSIHCCWCAVSSEQALVHGDAVSAV